jgi:hypothetical protein
LLHILSELAVPRTLKDAKIESRAARTRLKTGRDYWKTLEPARLHLGYRRKSKDQAGLWLARRYKGGERYLIASLGLADDLNDSGPSILSYAAAARAAHAHIWDGPARRRAS